MHVKYHVFAFFSPRKYRLTKTTRFPFALMLSAAALSFLPTPHSYHSSRHTRLITPAHPPLRVAVAMVAEPAAMKLKEIKAELDELGVAWKGVYFERDDLARALMTARARGPAPAKSAAAHPADAAPAAEPPAAVGAPKTPSRAVDLTDAAAQVTAQLEASELAWEAQEASRLAELQARVALFSASGALRPGQVPWP